MAICTKTWHWNCGSSLCANNYRTKGITYYTLRSDPELHKGYKKVLINGNINWRNRVLCSGHWSSGNREKKNHLPRKNMLLTWKKVLNKTIQGIKKENGLYKNGSYINFCTYRYASYSSQCVNITIRDIQARFRMTFVIA